MNSFRTLMTVAMTAALATAGTTPATGADTSGTTAPASTAPVALPTDPLVLLNLKDTATARIAVPIALRDGTILQAIVITPRQAAAEKVPAILIQTPYNAMRELRAGGKLFTRLVENGYAIVVVNVRGTQWSEGAYRWMKGAADDGIDVIDWITQQSWSDRKIGTYGCSSSGEVQYSLAKRNPPALKASIAMAAATGFGRIPGYDDQGIFYTGGVPMLSWVWWYRGNGYLNHPKFPRGVSDVEREALTKTFSAASNFESSDDLSWATQLPTQDLLHSVGSPDSEWNRLIRLAPSDPAWREYDFINTGDSTTVPMLHVDSWYDTIEAYATTKGFEYLSANSPNQYLIMGGTAHCRQGRETEETMVGDRPIGDARFDYETTMVAWFDHWIKRDGKGPFAMPRVQYYPLEANSWRQGTSWPPKSVPWPLYLSSGGNANSLNGDGRLVNRIGSGRPDMFISDPANPVPSAGGGCCDANVSRDQRDVEKRKDVLVYTTEPLTETRRIAGYIEATLYVSADVKDTDIAFKLVDVYPDGRAFNILDTIQRLRYRQGVDEAVWMKKGEVYEVRLRQMLVASHFAKGHRIRIEIAGTNFPQYDRNLNTGGKNFDETIGKIARIAIHHDKRYPSVVVFPETAH